MTIGPWRGLRAAIIAIATAAVLLNGLRAMPPAEYLSDCYQLWLGVQQARRNLALAEAEYRRDSGSRAPCVRAEINLTQSKLQLRLCFSHLTTDPVGLICAGALLLSGLAAAVAIPIIGTLVIRRRWARPSRASRPRAA